MIFYSCTHSFIFPFLSAYYMPATVLVTWGSVLNKTDRFFHLEASDLVTLILGWRGVKSEEQLVNWDWEEMEASTVVNTVINAC